MSVDAWGLRRLGLVLVVSRAVACDAGHGTSTQSSAAPERSAAAATATAAATAAELSPRRVTVSGGPYELQADLLVPTGRGPFPAVVYNHGSEQNPSLKYLGDTARWLAMNGFVALVPYRRGCSGSAGPYWKQSVAMRPKAEYDAALVDNLEQQTADVAAAVRWLAKRPDVDAGRVAVAGCSLGGVVSLLMAERGIGIRAAVDFAGGSILWKRNAALRSRMMSAAAAAKVPVFFLQAENDFNTAPTRLLSARMRESGNTARSKVFPPHGATPMHGHAHFCNRAQDEWGPDVLDALRRWTAPRAP